MHKGISSWMWLVNMITVPAISAENPRQNVMEQHPLDSSATCQFWMLRYTYELLQFANLVSFVMTILQQRNNMTGVTETPQQPENWMSI
jgi:hypothetical protein